MNSLLASINVCRWTSGYFPLLRNIFIFIFFFDLVDTKDFVFYASNIDCFLPRNIVTRSIQINGTYSEKYSIILVLLAGKTLDYSLSLILDEKWFFEEPRVRKVSKFDQLSRNYDETHLAVTMNYSEKMRSSCIFIFAFFFLQIYQLRQQTRW